LTAPPREGVRRWLREPLLHFLILGGALFAADAWRRAADESRVIVVTRAVRADLARELSARLGRAATSAELDGAIERYEREEAIYREAIRQGLDRGDSEVRARLIAKALELQRSLFVPPEPSAAALDAFLNQHRAHYEVSPRYDFDHVFASKGSPNSKERAEAILRDLSAGKAAEDLGDPFPRGRAFVAQSPARIAQVFGKGFADAVRDLAPGRWTLVESDHGYHGVLLRLSAGGLPPRELLGQRLIEDYENAALEKAMAAYVSDLTNQYERKVEP
jgi:hypothetical protein